MTSISVYRSIAVLGALFLIADAIYIGRQESLTQFSRIIDLVVAPITVIAASFWYHKNIVLIGVAFYFMGYAGEMQNQFNLISLSNPLKAIVDELYIMEVIGLVLVIAGGFEKVKYSKTWLNRKIYNVEFIISITALISFLSMTGLIVLLN